MTLMLGLASPPDGFLGEDDLEESTGLACCWWLLVLETVPLLAGCWLAEVELLASGELFCLSFEATRAMIALICAPSGWPASTEPRTG